MKSNLSQIQLVFLLGALSCRIVAAQTASSSDVFRPYTACSLKGGPSVVETSPLDAGVTSRTVQTMKGSYTVHIVNGRRVMFAYPGEDFYANIKVELLPKEGYAQSKQALISDFDHTLASGENPRNYALKPLLHEFDIRGLDRVKREGGVLGIYLIFDDATRTVITIYFLNQEPPKRFKTIEEYAVVRDRFLDEYTTCVRKELNPR